MSEQDNYQPNNQQSSDGLSPAEVASYLQNGLEPTMSLVREGANDGVVSSILRNLKGR